MSFDKINIREATIIDVREPFECRMGKVEGSINIPLGEVPSRLNEIKTMKKPLVICCASGGRSGQAAHFLTQNGVEEVYNGGGWNMVAMRMC